MNDETRWVLRGEAVSPELNAKINAQVAEGCVRCNGLGFCPPWMDDDGKITDASRERLTGDWDCHLCNGSGRKDGDRDKPYGVFEPRNVRDAKKNA